MEQELTDQMKSYHRFKEEILGPEGFTMPHGVIIDDEGKVTMLALAVPPDQAYEIMLRQITSSGAKEAIWALDRYAKPDQGTQYDDLLAGQHYVSDLDKPMSECFRGFIIQYQWEPRVWGEVDYQNQFWGAVLRHELLRASGGSFIRLV